MKLPERKEGFVQVCVLMGTTLNGGKEISIEHVMDFEATIMNVFQTRCHFLQEIKTNPDIENGKKVEGTGGRTDLLFAIHNDDVGKFAIPRLQYNIRWFEDVVNNNPGLYNKEIEDYYYCWKKD